MARKNIEPSGQLRVKRPSKLKCEKIYLIYELRIGPKQVSLKSAIDMMYHCSILTYNFQLVIIVKIVNEQCKEYTGKFS